MFFFSSCYPTKINIYSSARANKEATWHVGWPEPTPIALMALDATDWGASLHEERVVGGAK